MTKFEYTNVNPYPLGAHAENGTVRFAFVSAKEDCGVLIYDRESGRKLHKLPFSPHERIGNIHCMCLTDISAADISYQFYEGDDIVPDRYARRFTGPVAFGKERRLQTWRAVIPVRAFDWENDQRPGLSYSESVCYCAHVRGFTRHVSSGVEHRGTFLGMAEKLDYLQDTGVTTVELQPVYEFAELPTELERREALRGRGAYMTSEADMDMLLPKKCNYWGYKQGYYYAPKAAYAAGEDPCSEFKEMIRAFHKRRMEVVLQFYFPGSVKPLEITEILKFWVLEYHVDGFHLMGENLPVNLIASDELLSDTKLWYYHFDTEQIYKGQEPPEAVNLAAYTDEYLYAMRRYLKGDEGMLDNVLYQMRRIPDGMGRIHYMSNYYGFTLMDMVSYDGKHNDANGEDNRDGNNCNYSWNCGEEGPCRRKKVLALRHKQIKNAMVMLLFTQSTPLIFMGDEFGNSQKGNNNPYCQDNAVTWLDWNDLRKNADIYDFWRELVKLRRDHPILHPGQEMKIMDYISCGYPDLSYHGQSAWRPRTEGYNRHIGILYCGKYARLRRDEEDAFIYLAMNMYWESRELALPKLPAGMKWRLAKCTEERGLSAGEQNLVVPGRSCCVYISVMDEAERKKGKRVRKTQSPKAVKKPETPEGAQN